MLAQFEIHTESIQNRKASNYNNGDSLEKYVTENKDFVILVLSDGVSSTDKHWIASEMICKDIVKFISVHNMQNIEMEKLILDAISNSNSNVLNSDICSGALATLVLVVWDVNNDFIYWSSIGDSNLCLLKNTNELLTLSVEETAVEMIIEYGKPKMIDGAPATRKLLTNAMGSAITKIKVHKHDFLPGEALFLTSDGFMEALSAPFDAIQQTINKSDLDKSFIELCNDVRANNYDDASIIILRRNDRDENHIPAHLSNTSIIKTLIESILNEDIFSIETCIENIKDQNLSIGKANYLELLSTFQKSRMSNNKEVWSLLQPLVRFI